MHPLSLRKWGRGIHPYSCLQSKLRRLRSSAASGAMVTGGLLPLAICLLLLFLCSASVSSSDLVLEPGYTVETVFDGHGVRISPFSVIPHADGLILLDNVHSAFYRAPLPISLASVFNHISGNGNGFLDGDLVKAMFNRPRSFTVDDNGNIYVADRANFAIRKISKSGVTTIAGGYAGKSGKSGHADGPSQNATFSNDFELIFVRKICALMISDRANDLIRHIKLRSEDCLRDIHTGLGMTSTAIIIVSCILLVLSFGAGIVAGPFITQKYTGRRQLQQDEEALPNRSAETHMDPLLCHQKRSC